MPCSAILDKLLLAADGNKCRDPQPDVMQRMRDPGTLSFKQDVSIKSLPSGFIEPCRREDRVYGPVRMGDTKTRRPSK